MSEVVDVSASPFDLHHGDNVEVMRELAEGSIDACVCDPPYGLSDHPDAAQVLRAWLEDDHFEHAGAGFMGRSWDAFVPSPRVWREVFRVLKPGGYLLAFSGTRSQDFMGMSIRLAGFEIRDNVLNWAYSEGWPKGVDLAKALAAAGDEGGAAQWAGWHTTLKASQEPLIVARKPLEGGVVENVLAHGVGAMNIEACRVPTTPRPTGSKALSTVSGRHGIYGEDKRRDRAMRYDANAPSGRWPTNLTLTHHPLCVRIGERRVATGTAQNENRSGGVGRVFGRALVKPGSPDAGYADADGKESIELWACVPGCVVRALDEQVGPTRSGSMRAGQPRNRTQPAVYDGMGGSPNPVDIETNTGAASRFYPNFYYAPKVAALERDIGLESGQNRHVAVKPISLCRWFIRLVTPRGGLVLDPYMGSGSMGCAAVLEGARYFGIELDPEGEGWVEIARKRIQWCIDHPGAFDPVKRNGAPPREEADQIRLL